MAPITSSRRPTRPSALRAHTQSRNPGCSSMPAVMGVSIKVGHTVFTRIPAGPSSHASARVMPSSACLLAQYKVRRGLPTCPICDDTLMIDPGRPSFSRRRATARLV
ncbi:hypothetical protein D3C72_2182160 [compost metagenome]